MENSIRSVSFSDSAFFRLLLCRMTREIALWFSYRRYDREAQELICDPMNMAYPIWDGIPNMIPSDARNIGDDKRLGNADGNPDQES